MKSAFAQPFMIFAASLVFMTANVIAQQDESTDKPSFTASQTVQMTATVEAIDMATREVTLRGEDGESQTITVGPEARNLGQVKPGDVVTAEFTRELDIQVFADDGGELGAGTLTAAGRSEQGEMPGGMAVTSEVITAKVAEINLDSNTFKLQWPDGSVEEFVAQNPENLQRADVGDIVVITYTVAAGIVVAQAPGE